jgi:hypothetical protein
MSFNMALTQYVKDALSDQTRDERAMRQWFRQLGYGGGRTAAILQAVEHGIEFLKCRPEIKNVIHRIGGVGRLAPHGHKLIIGGPVLYLGVELPVSFAVEVTINQHDKLTHDGQYAAGVTHVSESDNEFFNNALVFVNAVTSAIDRRYDLYSAQTVVSTDDEFEACWIETPQLSTPMGIEVKARINIDRNLLSKLAQVKRREA